MHALAISSLVFLLVFGGAVTGMVVRRTRPDERFTPEAKETIRLAIGLVVTMTSLVLGMLVSSGKATYDGEKNQVAEMSAQVILLSDLLKAYGPETVPLRTEARQAVEDIIDRVWPRDSGRASELRPSDRGSDLYKHLRELAPKNEVQASTKAQLLTAMLNLRKMYRFMFLQSEQTSIALPLLAVVTSWLVLIFFSFGLFAPRLSNVFLTLVVCALAVSAAVYIIVSMNSPFEGVFRISPAAVQDVLGQITGGR